ncbi:1,2-diacylglycerol-3-alpha-glucose alpha-1,2-galactosyltransferase [Anaerobacterium chartisolvens]|uniref:1,2-diacylglycerol-3-alpha-glucose alpha-1,2-galactosyltransferase n=1 Tax=Anaerobacterium chartisolvens TaxID=1297424 RepID=A0A369B5Q4_9FIRM|nr:glycosyltransferase family 4 protein [Anaerobacterium chartisolvens]RCX16840.1 1,2-diacylglycerol-3-alpha-glucose alpha-1,2-galactosyltransferase [Anaerobacterium chartisolvens]
MISINMISSAVKVKGQGVGSAYIEQVRLVNEGLGSGYKVYENKPVLADIMHYHTIDLKHFFIAPFARIKGVNVGYVHFLPETIEGSIDLPSSVKKIFYKYIIAFYKSMDYLVAVNPYFIKRLSEYGIDSKRIAYIPNFVSGNFFRRMIDGEKKVLRKKYGIGERDFVVLGVGQVQTRKGVVDFINAAEQLKDVKFLWAGGFSFGRITSGYKTLKGVVDSPPPNVKFMGIVEREHMNEIYNIADVLLLPSYSELFPMAILEAFACGIPVLLRDLDIYPDVFFDYYIKGNTSSDFAAAIERLKNDREYYGFCKAQAYKGHEYYCEENILSMWREFYGKVSKKINLAEDFL